MKPREKRILELALACALALVAGVGHAATPMTPPWYEVVVDQAGVAQGTPNPAYIVILTDVNGAFSERWFRVDTQIANQVLDVALTAQASGAHARVYLPNTAAGQAVLRFYLLEPGIDMRDYGNPSLTKTYSIKYYSGGATASENTMVITTTQFPDGSIEERDTYLDGSYEIWPFSWTEDGLAGPGYRRYDASGILQVDISYDKAIVWHTPAGRKQVGDSWGEGFVDTQTVYDPSGAVTGTYIRPRTMMVTILGFEDVTVPAGTFTDCVKLYRSRGESTDTVLWYAKGIGYVKRVYAGSGTSLVYELTSYH